MIGIFNKLEVYHPQQIEFARLNISFSVLSKRKLKQLVDEKHVDGWDDPRMPTISGLRRRGYTPSSIRNFSNSVGITKRNSIIDLVRLENTLREELNKTAPRVFAVVDPIKVIITNYPKDKTETIQAINNPEDPDSGTRQITFSKELYIEKKRTLWRSLQKNISVYRLGRKLGLNMLILLNVQMLSKIQKMKIIEIHCSYDPESFGGKSSDGRKVKGTLHWVSAKNAINSKIYHYDRLFLKENP